MIFLVGSIRFCYLTKSRFNFQGLNETPQFCTDLIYVIYLIYLYTFYFK